MNSIIPVPQALNISPESRSYNWDLFQQAWNNYEIAVGLSEKSNEQRVATLLSIIGYDALQVYNAFYWNNDEQKTVESVMNKFGVYCKPKKNVTYERFTFMSRRQRPNENINDFVVALRNLSRNCEYEHLTDSVIRDAIVMGVRNKKTQESLLRENNLTMDSCINIARAAERAQQHSSFITSEERSNEQYEKMEIDKISEKKKDYGRSKCKFCGNEHIWGRKNCPAYGKTCVKCKGLNHFSKVCKTRNERVSVLAEESENEFAIH